MDDESAPAKSTECFCDHPDRGALPPNASFEFSLGSSPKGDIHIHTLE
jgi:hypothetical protein